MLTSEARSLRDAPEAGLASVFRWSVPAILGHSWPTAKVIPCSGEGDRKTAIAMKICGILAFGGSYSEVVTSDYDRETVIFGHDGPFHIDIADG